MTFQGDSEDKIVVSAWNIMSPTRYHIVIVIEMIPMQA